MLDDGLDNIELRIVRGYEVRDSAILEEQVLRLFTPMDENSYVTLIIKTKIRSVTLTISLYPYQGIQDSVPVLLETITLPGKHSRNSSCLITTKVWSWVEKNFARTPADVTVEGIES